MPYFIYHTEPNLTLIFKGGSIEAAPNKPVMVSKTDVESGVFDQFQAEGRLTLVEADTAPVLPTATLQPIVASRPDEGMSQEEYQAFLAKKKAEPAPEITPETPVETPKQPTRRSRA